MTLTIDPKVDSTSELATVDTQSVVDSTSTSTIRPASKSTIRPGVAPSSRSELNSRNLALPDSYLKVSHSQLDTETLSKTSRKREGEGDTFMTTKLEQLDIKKEAKETQTKERELAKKHADMTEEKVLNYGHNNAGRKSIGLHKCREIEQWLDGCEERRCVGYGPWPTTP